jgi:hypothetical protein
MQIHSLLTQAVLLSQTAAHHNDIKGLLGGAGYTDSAHQAGLQLIARAHQGLQRIYAQLQSDKASVHLIHSSATELEMWLQTARQRALKGGGSQEQVALAVGSHLHGPDHTLTVMAQALRFLSLVRADEVLRQSLGSPRSVQDLLQRGHVLLCKLQRCAQDAAMPEGTDAREQVCSLALELKTWVDGAHQAAERGLSGQPRLMGMVGYTPASIAIPLGGAAGRVTLHQQTSGQAPVGGPSQAAPGWSAGRQGRNAQNQGQGYHPPRA